MINRARIRDRLVHTDVDQLARLLEIYQLMTMVHLSGSFSLMKVKLTSQPILARKYKIRLYRIKN